MAETATKKRKRGPDEPEADGDRYRTPPWLFTFLSQRYGPFDVDLCADHDNAKLPVYFTRRNSCVAEGVDWLAYGTRGFCNPPYSDPKPFVLAAVEYAKRGFSTTFVLPTHRNQVWASMAMHATERLEFIGRVNFWLADGSAEQNGNRGGTMVYHFRAFDLGYTRTAWVDVVETRKRIELESAARLAQHDLVGEYNR